VRRACVTNAYTNSCLQLSASCSSMGEGKCEVFCIRRFIGASPTPSTRTTVCFVSAGERTGQHCGCTGLRRVHTDPACDATLHAELLAHATLLRAATRVEVREHGDRAYAPDAERGRQADCGTRQHCEQVSRNAATYCLRSASRGRKPLVGALLAHGASAVRARRRTSDDCQYGGDGACDNSASDEAAEKTGVWGYA
jgi:hypothetical protein